MNNDDKPCPHCGGGPLFVKYGVQSGGVWGPVLLPDLGPPFAMLDVVVCESCGFVQFFLNRSGRKKLAKAWTSVSGKSKTS